MKCGFVYFLGKRKDTFANRYDYSWLKLQELENSVGKLFKIHTYEIYAAVIAVFSSFTHFLVFADMQQRKIVSDSDT